MTDKPIKINRTDGVKYIEPAELVEFGYLQEVNRQFFHPLGLALEVALPVGEDSEGNPVPGFLVGVWDYRDDLEGIYMAPNPGVEGDTAVNQVKALNVAAEWNRRQPTREVALGYMVQPVVEEEPVPPSRLSVTQDAEEETPPEMPSGPS